MSLHTVFIPTTRHAAQVLSITEEDPEIRSVVCLNDSFEALPISTRYDQFVRRPTGIIEKILGRAAYRVDVSAPITQGDSWQLGVCLAHILHNQDKFSAVNAEVAVWATGEVDPHFRVKPVDHIDAKIKTSYELLTNEERAGRKVIILAAPENVAELRILVPKEWEVHGTATLDEACATIGTQMPTNKSAQSSDSYTTPPIRHNLIKRYLSATAIALLALTALNVPYKSLMDSINYERDGELRALRMEMRKINRQKNWVATNAYYFFEVFFLLRKSTQLENSFSITTQTINKDTTTQAITTPNCGKLFGVVVSEVNLSLVPKGGCLVTFNVTSRAKTNVRIWLAVIEQGNDGSPSIIMKHGADLEPGQQFVTPKVTINSQTTRLVAAISDRSDKAWSGWFNNLLRSSTFDIMELEIDRLTSTGVGVFQARWHPFIELN